jgi:hypothetical protein
MSRPKSNGSKRSKNNTLKNPPKEEPVKDAKPEVKTTAVES